MPLGLGLGLSISNPPPPPASAWPSIADIPQGALVLDSDGVVKQCRWVVDLNGPDTIKLPVLSFDLRFIPWEMEWVCNDLAFSQSGTSRLFQISTSASGNTTAALLYKTTQTNIVLEFRNSSGVGLLSVTASVPSSGFFKVKIKKNGTTSGTCQLYVNDVLLGTSFTLDYSSWTGADQISSISMTDLTADLRPYQVLNYRSVLDGTLHDCIEMSESSGVSLVNQCDPTRPATLSDSQAHKKALVPVSLL